MSRAKFEEWWESCHEFKDGRPTTYEMCEMAWLAGRESMRDEALKSCGDIGPDAYKAFHAIKEIKL